MSNKASTYNSYTYYKYHIPYTTIYIYIYIFLTISTHLKTYQTLFQELIAKSLFSWKIYIYNAKRPSYERQNTKSHFMEGNITHT